MIGWRDVGKYWRRTRKEERKNEKKKEQKKTQGGVTYQLVMYPTMPLTNGMSAKEIQKLVGYVSGPPVVELSPAGACRLRERSNVETPGCASVAGAAPDADASANAATSSTVRAASSAGNAARGCACRLAIFPSLEGALDDVPTVCDNSRPPHEGSVCVLLGDSARGRQSARVDVRVRARRATQLGVSSALLRGWNGAGAGLEAGTWSEHARLRRAGGLSAWDRAPLPAR